MRAHLCVGGLFRWTLMIPIVLAPSRRRDFVNSISSFALSFEIAFAPGKEDFRTIRRR
jgi:hypothetical protein